jgi:hypothetical protein
MLDQGDIPPECESLAYDIVPRADLDHWRATRNQGQDRFQARQRLYACLQTRGLLDFLR